MSGTVVIWYAETRSAKQFKLRMRWGRKSRISHEGCMCDSERRRASAALMPPFPPAALLYSSYCFCPVSSREQASHPRNHHLSLFTCDAISPQHRVFLTHDHLRGRDDAMYLLWGIDRLKVTVANAFNSVVLHPRWLTQEKLNRWTVMLDYDDPGGLVCFSQQTLEQSVWLVAKWESSCQENTIWNLSKVLNTIYNHFNNASSAGPSNQRCVCLGVSETETERGEELVKRHWLNT